jgi:hemerythrin superfamily protein
MATKRATRGIRGAPDAISLLKADHKEVSALFERFEHSRAATVKQRLAQKICQALLVHTRIEEEIFYPTVRPEIEDDDLMNEALVEHAGAKDLIAQIKRSKPTAPLFEAKVTVLSEYIKHHVKEEHTELFPKARKTALDMKALGARLLARKRALRTKRGLP